MTAGAGLRTVGAGLSGRELAAGRAGVRGDTAVVEEPALTFADLLRQLRTETRLTQEELAAAASLSPRSISDLERGINRTARKETAVLLARALSLPGPVAELFVAAARGGALLRTWWRPGGGWPWGRSLRRRLAGCRGMSRALPVGRLTLIGWRKG